MNLIVKQVISILQNWLLHCDGQLILTDTEVKRLQIKPPPRWKAVKTSTRLGPFDFLEVAFIHEHFAPIPTV